MPVPDLEILAHEPTAQAPSAQSPLSPKGLAVLSLCALGLSIAALAASLAIWRANETRSSSIEASLSTATQQTSDLSERVDKLITTTSEAVKSLDAEIKAARRQIFLSSKGFVDLTTPNLQDIGDGFYVSRLALTPHLSGVKMTGRLINSTALIHENCSFTITIGEVTQNISILRIASGSSSEFNAYVPDVPPEKTKVGEIRYKESIARYGTY